MNRLLSFLYPVWRLTPEHINSELFARTANHLLRGQDLALRLPELNGKYISFYIRDIPCKLHFKIQNGRLQASSSDKSDIVISGDLESFIQLVTRQQDPDTLFFNRELNIEGETETGVHIKNLLDSLEYDWNAHFDAVLPSSLADCAKSLMHKVRRVLPRQ